MRVMPSKRTADNRSAKGPHFGWMTLILDVDEGKKRYHISRMLEARICFLGSLFFVVPSVLSMSHPGQV